MAGAAVLGSQTANGCIAHQIDLPPGTSHPDSLAIPVHVAVAPLSRGARSPAANFVRRAGFRVSVLCAAKSVLDRTTMDITGSDDLHWTEEVLSALQRSLLESQWALASAESAADENGIAITPIQSKDLIEVVRSGRPSARQRRLGSKVRKNVASNSAARPAFSINVPTTGQPALEERRRKKVKAKLEPVQDFISSFLKPTNSCPALTKDEEQGFTKQMRIRQSLDKAKRKLCTKLGHEPSWELWAHSVHVSTGELLSKVADGEMARNTMMTAHLRLVVSVAKHYQYLGVDMADLIQEGSKGLLRGLERFDHRKGCKLSTYVHWWIRQGVTRAIADRSRMMRVPVYMHETLFAIKKGRAQLINEGKPVTVKNLSKLLNISSTRVQNALQVKSKFISLDKVTSFHGLKEEWNGMHEIVPDRNLQSQPWALLERAQTKGHVMKRIATLTPREQMVIQWHYGVGTKGGARSTLTALGEKMGLSKERVRQIKYAAMQKMKSSAEDSSILTNFHTRLI